MSNKKFTVTDIRKAKKDNKKISMITAYDYSFAKAADEAGIEIILVGDSLGMVVLGYEDTTKVTMEDMIHHSKAVSRGAKKPFIVTDMPFMSYGYDIKKSVKNAGRLVKEGNANCVKLEGGKNVSKIVKEITSAGIPVCGHIGYTPQSTNVFGRNMVRGKNYEIGKNLIEDALALQNAGAVMIVLELVPQKLATLITSLLKIPTIGIGSGNGCNGQVLVINDMLGLTPDFNPKHNKKYAEFYSQSIGAISLYIDEIKEMKFPTEDNSFEINDDDFEKLRVEYE